MKLAASYALVSLITEEELNENNVIANAFDPRVVEREAVAKAAKGLPFSLPLSRRYEPPPHSFLI